MRVLFLVILCGFILPGAGGAQGGAAFFGEWDTTEGKLVLEARNGLVAGTFGPAGKHRLSGRVAGDRLNFSFRRGRDRGFGHLRLLPAGYALQGEYQIESDPKGYPWKGWRRDPTARDGVAADFTGLWRTSLGVGDFHRQGREILGPVGSEFDYHITGTSVGRRFVFSFQASGGAGGGWAEMNPDGKGWQGCLRAEGAVGFKGFTGQRLEGHTKKPQIKARTIISCLAGNRLTYHLWTARKNPRGQPLLVILHERGMGGREYVATMVRTWPKLVREYLLVGIDGERWDDTRAAGFPAFSYGCHQGGAAKLVAPLLGELQDRYGPSRIYLGGHGQGGQVAYALHRRFPGRVAGVFPLAASMPTWCLPGGAEKMEGTPAQLATPVAIVHGNRDRVVPFAAAQQAYWAFSEHSFSRYALFTGNKDTHVFEKLPLARAVNWLARWQRSSPRDLLDFARGSLNAGRQRDLIALIPVLESLKLSPAQTRQVVELKGIVNAAARIGAAKYDRAIKWNKDGTWIEGFLAYRDKYEFAPIARPVMKIFAELRAKHEKAGALLFAQAKELAREKPREAKKLLRRLVSEFYACSFYRPARRYLQEWR